MAAPSIGMLLSRGSTAAGEDVQGKVRTPGVLLENSEPSPSCTEGPQPFFQPCLPLPPLPLLSGRAPASQCGGHVEDQPRKSVSLPASALSALSSSRASWQKPGRWNTGTHLTALFLFFFSLSLLLSSFLPSSPVTSAFQTNTKRDKE